MIPSQLRNYYYYYRRFGFISNWRLEFGRCKSRRVFLIHRGAAGVVIRRVVAETQRGRDEELFASDAVAAAALRHCIRYQAMTLAGLGLDDGLSPRLVCCA